MTLRAPTPEGPATGPTSSRSKDHAMKTSLVLAMLTLALFLVLAVLAGVGPPMIANPLLADFTV